MNKRVFLNLLLLISLVFGQLVSVVHLTEHLHIERAAPAVVLSGAAFAGAFDDVTSPRCTGNANGAHDHSYSHAYRHGRHQHGDQANGCESIHLVASRLSHAEAAVGTTGPASGDTPEECAALHILAAGNWCFSAAVLAVTLPPAGADENGLVSFVWPASETRRLPPIRGSPRLS